MAIQAQYKKYKRGQRQADVETDFSNGMMFTEGTVTEGYVKTLVNFDFTQDSKNALKPRAALTTYEVITPDMDADLLDYLDYLDDDTLIKYSKECVENGIDYRQFILGKTDLDVSGEALTQGKLWLVTSRKSVNTFEDLVIAGSELAPASNTCAFYNTALTEIHEVRLTDDAKSAFPVGAFLGNSFYFFDDAGQGVLKKTVFDTDRYVFENAVIKELTASEAVNYGYNMLDANPYEFKDLLGAAASFQMEGILPYDRQFESGSEPKLLMTPKANTRVWFRCNYSIPTDGRYKIVWSWKELTKDEWSVFATTVIEATAIAEDLPVLQADLHCPTKEIMIRCEAYKYVNASDLYDWETYEKSIRDPRYGYNKGEGSNPSYSYNEEYFYNDYYDHWNVDSVYDSAIAQSYPSYASLFDKDGAYEETVERAMTVGFDFTINADNSTTNVQPELYDLSTATGMISWKNRLVVWGLPKDPTILFISDLDEPGYFPYPNNITVFDEPIISVAELMDNLIVFTKSKVYQVVLNEDGYTWISTVIQSNLYIEPWDKHLIQTVRNMVYFKSGNYYYMIVPKAQSTTGELTLAPITTPISEFFNHFQFNVSNIFKECFKTLDNVGGVLQHNPEELLTYYNFIDYESIHNFYVYRYFDRYVHFDIIYNVVDRYWKINIYESAQFLYPFRNDTTHSGLLAVTNVISVNDIDNDSISDQRIIQLCKFNDAEIEDIYIVSDSEISYYKSGSEGYEIINETLGVPFSFSSYDESLERFSLTESFIRTKALEYEQLSLIDSGDWVGGFNRANIKDSLDDSLKQLRNNTLFPNKQMIDTGFRDMNLFVNKRYRELQLHINNLNNVDMEFGMDFQISGEPRNTYFLYEVSQTIDEINQDKGIAYLDATPYLPIEAEEIDKTNRWTLKHSLIPDVSLWKVRASVSGKGTAPRLRLFTRGMFNYQLLGINWIYREMNMR